MSNVHSIGPKLERRRDEDAVIALANSTGQERSEQDSTERGRGGAVALGAVVLGAAYLLTPRADHAPVPETDQMTYIDHVQESAKTPYNPETDTLIVDGITVSPEHPTASEAVLGDEGVQNYLEKNQDETSAATASAFTLGAEIYDDSTEFALVERDADGDGDPDAIAVRMQPKE